MGFVPGKKKPCAEEFITKEYGAARTVTAAGAGLFGAPGERFPSAFMRICVMAVLKLPGNLSAKDMDAAYGRSAVSLLLPEAHPGKNTVSDFLFRLSSQREGMVRFTGSRAGCGDGGTIFGGTSFARGSARGPFCEKGHSPGHIGQSQIRLIYAYGRTNHRPVYFRVVPGSASDKRAFETCLDGLDGKAFTVILGKGFFSGKNIGLVTGMDFIMPLQKNTAQVPAPFKVSAGYERAPQNSFSYHKRTVCFTELDAGKFGGCRVCV
jgi:hypothetical protein